MRNAIAIFMKLHTGKKGKDEPVEDRTDQGKKRVISTSRFGNAPKSQKKHLAARSEFPTSTLFSSLSELEMY
jgi:hypothetical protein